MNRRLVAIEARRARLPERAAREREQLAQALQSLAQPLAFADQLRSSRGALCHFARPPLRRWTAANVVFVFATAARRPRRAFKRARRAFQADGRVIAGMTRKIAALRPCTSQSSSGTVYGNGWTGSENTFSAKSCR